ncbi:MAG TPA: hypothetical protein VFQ53_22395 [Kofleriaceae bacterium]|nr:hypothetical protein [Kofleriaceae bacterium]
MPRGSKKSYTSKQRRQAEHIEESGKSRGMSSKRAKAMAYATVNKQDGGGKKSGSGRGKKRSTASSRKGGRKGGAASRGGRKTSSRGGRKSSSRSR